MVERLLISQRDACKALGIARKTLIEEINQGRLRYVLVGKRRKFKTRGPDQLYRKAGAMARRSTLYQWRADKHCYRESFTVGTVSSKP